MTRTDVTCLTCGTLIAHHWQLQDHATCQPPTLDATVEPIVTLPGQQAACLTWCDVCGEYHLRPHQPIGRHVRRAVRKMLQQEG